MMMMMMMSRFVERVVNGPQTRCRSAEQAGLQMSSERQWGESCGSQGISYIGLAYMCTEFDDFGFNRSSDMIGTPKDFNGSHYYYYYYYKICIAHKFKHDLITLF